MNSLEQAAAELLKELYPWTSTYPPRLLPIIAKHLEAFARATQPKQFGPDMFEAYKVACDERATFAQQNAQLKEQNRELLRMLELAAYKIWDCVLVGNQCEHVKNIFHDMRNPQAGDLVFETSTIMRGHLKGCDGLEPRGISGVGILNRVTREPIYSPEAWKEAGGSEAEPIPTEKVFYIKLFDGREFRWVNAEFLKIPITLEQTETKTERINERPTSKRTD